MKLWWCHKRFREAVVVVCLASAAMSFQSGFASEAGLLPEQVKQALLENTLRVRDIKADVSCSMIVYGEKGMSVLDELRYEGFWARKGTLARFDSRMLHRSGGQIPGTLQRHYFDGERAYNLYYPLMEDGNAADDPRTVYIEGASGVDSNISGVLGAFSPSRLWLYLTPDTYDSVEIRCLGNEEYNGVECLVAEIVAPYSVDMKVEVWLDPNRNYLMVKKVETISESGHYSECLPLEFAQPEPGVFVVIEGVLNMFAKDRDLGIIRNAEIQLAVQNIAINTDLPNHLFRPEIPEGTQVFDKLAGLEYRWKEPLGGLPGDELDGLVDEVVALAFQDEQQTLEKSPPAPLKMKGLESPSSPVRLNPRRNPSSSIGWILCCICLLAVLAFVARYVVKRRRPSKGDARI